MYCRGHPAEIPRHDPGSCPRRFSREPPPRELKGEVVARKADDTPWDHAHEVRNAQNGLLKTIGDINKKLAHPKTGGAERDLLVADLGRASRMLDYSEQFVPRG
ncbi:polymorphic toxin type 28 domain-containing protein [Streptomyces sp. NPDC046976]|uniref:polymorphic toxin type 28 domain-containing protein n=1 Tax=Streptomyces sp. NPDC046976 TaxID=3155258 RepID=UPI003404FE1A